MLNVHVTNVFRQIIDRYEKGEAQTHALEMHQFPEFHKDTRIFSLHSFQATSTFQRGFQY